MFISSSAAAAAAGIHVIRCMRLRDAGVIQTFALFGSKPASKPKTTTGKVLHRAHIFFSLVLFLFLFWLLLLLLLCLSCFPHGVLLRFASNWSRELGSAHAGSEGEDCGRHFWNFWRNRIHQGKRTLRGLSCHVLVSTDWGTFPILSLSLSLRDLFSSVQRMIVPRAVCLFLDKWKQLPFAYSIYALHICHLTGWFYLHYGLLFWGKLSQERVPKPSLTLKQGFHWTKQSHSCCSSSFSPFLGQLELWEITEDLLMLQHP